jgi:hypothetical protein
VYEHDAFLSSALPLKALNQWDEFVEDHYREDGSKEEFRVYKAAGPNGEAMFCQ